MPLGRYIEHLYLKRFGKKRPDVVLSIEERIKLDEEKRAKKRELKMRALQNESNAGRSIE